MEKAIEALKQQIKALNAGEGHIKIEMEDKTIAVLSVYDDQRASHDILDDLVDWAQNNNDQKLLDKIIELATI